MFKELQANNFSKFPMKDEERAEIACAPSAGGQLRGVNLPTEACVMTGRIIKLIRDKGIGFVKGTDNVEYFFHRSAVSGNKYDSLQEGGGMEFEPNPNAPKGARAESCVPQ